MLLDDKGRVVHSWDASQFTVGEDGLSLELVTAVKVKGKAPWTLTLTVTDQAGETASAQAVITR